MEELLAKHRKEIRDLQSKITQKKKSATKKTRRGVNDECERLERELKERHQVEVRELEGGDEGEEGQDGGEVKGVDGELDLDRLKIKDDKDRSDSQDGISHTTTTTVTTTQSLESPTTHPQSTAVTSPSPSSSPTTLTLTPSSQPKKPNRQKARLARRAAEAAQAAEQASHEASSQTDHRAIERAQMAKLIADLGLVEKEIRSDGHCMYSAVAHALSSSSSSSPPSSSKDLKTNNNHDQQQYTYHTIRHLTATHILTHPSLYVPFLLSEDNDDSLESYTTKIAHTAEWGGELELSAISRWSGRRVNVVQAGGGGVRCIDLSSSEEKGEEGKKENEGEGEGEREGEIWLAYYRKSFGLGEHYNALERKRKE